MSTMKAVQVPHAGGAFELVERPLPEPREGQVRIKVEACGICHSDSLVKEGGSYPITYPRVPGHEVIGVIDAVGKGVHPWSAGQRVGVGWHGGHCLCVLPVAEGIYQLPERSDHRDLLRWRVRRVPGGSARGAGPRARPAQSG